MSTQRREGRWTPATGIGCQGLRHGSRIARCLDRAKDEGVEFPNPPARNLLANTAGRTAPLESLMNGSQAGGHKISANESKPPIGLRFGSPPVGRASSARGFAVPPKSFIFHPSPAESVQFHPALPRVPALLSCRTERYDGKGNLHLQHAA